MIIACGAAGAIAAAAGWVCGEEAGAAACAAASATSAIPEYANELTPCRIAPPSEQAVDLPR